MSAGKILISIVVALGLVSAAPAKAGEPHAHDDHSATVQLRLDNGKKWRTDEALRRGMDEIRKAIAESQTLIHENAFTPSQYDALAAGIQTQIDYVVGNCKLPEDADEQLHLMLEQLIDGVAEMKATTGGDKRAKGAERIARALVQYGEYFDHSGWPPPAR